MTKGCTGETVSKSLVKSINLDEIKVTQRLIVDKFKKERLKRNQRKMFENK